MGSKLFEMNKGELLSLKERILDCMIETSVLLENDHFAPRKDESFVQAIDELSARSLQKRLQFHLLEVERTIAFKER